MSDKIESMERFAAKQDAEIALLKAELKLSKENHALSSAQCSREMLNLAELHNGVSAQAYLLKNKLGDVVLAEQNNSGYEPSLSCFQREITEASILLAKTPQQCLSEIQGAAEKKGYWQGFEAGTIFPGENILQHYTSWLDFKSKNKPQTSE